LGGDPHTSKPVIRHEIATKTRWGHPKGEMGPPKRKIATMGNGCYETRGVVKGTQG